MSQGWSVTSVGRGDTGGVGQISGRGPWKSVSVFTAWNS